MGFGPDDEPDAHRKTGAGSEDMGIPLVVTSAWMANPQHQRGGRRCTSSYKLGRAADIAVYARQWLHRRCGNERAELSGISLKTIRYYDELCAFSVECMLKNTQTHTDKAEKCG